VIERVDGAERELDVALGIDVVGYAQDDFGNVLHVAVLVDNYNALGNHGLALRPDGMHHHARLAGTALDILEHQCRAAGRILFLRLTALRAGTRSHLAHAVGDRGDFEFWRNLFADAAELAVFFECLDPVA
jgi:hypothetical protein